MTHETIHFLRDADLPGLEVGRACASPHAFPKHAHELYAIGLMEVGASYCLGPERDSSLVTPGGLGCINPGQVHSGVPVEGLSPTYSMFHVEPDLVRRIAAESSDTDPGYPEFPSIILRDADTVRAFIRLRNMFEHGGERLAKQSAMVEAFSLLLDRSGCLTSPARQPDPTHRAVPLVKEYLDAHLGDKVSLDELAEVAGLSRYHLLRVFKKATGMTPHAFLIQRRIERSRRLLREGRPIAEVALDLGFTDQSHFTNAFKQHLGATPGRYCLP